MKLKTVLQIVISAGLALVLIGNLFRIMHWPGAGIALISGMFVCAGAFIITFFEVSEKD